MQIIFTADKDYTINKDLHFQTKRYESKHVLVSLTIKTICLLWESAYSWMTQTFKNPDAATLNLLRESGPVPSDNSSTKKRSSNTDASARKKKRVAPNVSDACVHILFSFPFFYFAVWFN